MTTPPKEMTLAKLDVLVMPNGEILCSGVVIGWVSGFGEYLTDLKKAV